MEEDGKGTDDDAEDDEGCDTKPRSDGLLSGTSASSVITSNVFGPIWRNCKGGADEERLSMGEGGGWGYWALSGRTAVDEDGDWVD